MAVVMVLYFVIIFVLINLIVQIALYIKDTKERISLKISLSRQVASPKHIDAELVKNQGSPGN